MRRNAGRGRRILPVVIRTVHTILPARLLPAVTLTALIQLILPAPMK